MFHVPNQFRFTDRLSPLSSTEEDGNNGFFYIQFEGKTLAVMANNGMGWEHVSVSLKNRTPNWSEMNFIKGLFWDKDDCVVQFHPPESEYVNNHPNCLHLWRKIGYEFPLPDSIMVGIKEKI